jgi:tetratricopeptide (TPR) repeat protein
VRREVDAERAYRDALRKDAGFGDAHKRLLNLWLDRRQFNRIEEHAKAYLDNDRFFDTIGSRTGALASQGAPQVARSILEKALGRQRKSVETMLVVADAASKATALEIADGAYRAAAEMEPESRIYAEWGVVLHNLEKYEEAVEKFTRALEQDPKDASSLVIRAWSRTILVRDEEAIEDCRRALELNVDRASPLQCWGQNLSFQGKHEEAIEKYQEALEASPDDPDILALWAASLVNLNRYVEAIDRAKLAIKTDLSNVEAHYQLARALWFSNRRSESDERFAIASSQDPQRADILRDWGWLLMDMTRYDNAIDKLRRAHQLAPRDALTLCLLGNSLSNIGHDVEADTMCRRAVEIDPASYQAQVWLAEVLVKTGKPQEAMKHFAEAAALSPADPWCYQSWAKALMIQKDYVGAEEKYRLAAECTTDPKALASIYADWGNDLSKLHRHTEAGEKYRSALDYDPSNPVLRIQFAQQVAREGRLDEARALFLEAERRGPTTASELGNLGWGYYQTGDYEKSLSYSRRALELEPDALYARCNAGLALLHLNRLKEAEQEYARAVLVAERSLSDNHFDIHAIQDVEDALERTPDLPGGRALLDSLRRHLDRLRKLRAQNV